MPSGTLPIAGYLGDPQRTTNEFQGGIDELLAYVKSLKAEVDALSSNVIREAAVRGIGTAAGNVPDTAALNTRLGTSANLNLAAEIEDGRFDPALASTVWTGPATSTDSATWSEDGTGFYLFVWGDSTTEENGETLVFIDNGTAYDREVCATYIHPNIYVIKNTLSTIYEVAKISTADGTTSSVTLQLVRKV